MRSGIIALFLLTLCIPALPAHAQSTEADLKSRLMDKPLYLRGCWRDDKLHFDSAGRLTGNSDPVAFTLSGFELRTLHPKRDKLVLEGRRIGLEFANNQQKRVPISVGDPNNPSDELMHIEITASPSGDYGPALDAIFVDGLAPLVPSMPFYWKSYATKNFLPVDARTDSPATSSHSITPSSPETKPQRVGGAIKPPKLLRSTEPEFSEVVRRLKYSGVVLINCWVQPDGRASHLSIVRPLGLGLDERALASVQSYFFSPAMQDGKPVLVEVNVEVSFQIR